MSAGRLIAVVGPSGVGKDSVMEGIIAACPAVKRVKRTITRAPDLGGEDYFSVSPSEFAQAVEEGAFCVHWGAHDLHYGIPVQTLSDVSNGQQCLANFSRKALITAASVFERMIVLNITAKPATLAKRLAARGRESSEAIAKRLATADKPLPEGIETVHVGNDGPLHETVEAALMALSLAKTPQNFKNASLI